MAAGSPARILGFIAASEPLERTLAEFPGLTRSDLRALLRQAAVLLAVEPAVEGEAEVPAREEPPEPSDAPSGGAGAPRPQLRGGPAPEPRAPRRPALPSQPAPAAKEPPSPPPPLAPAAREAPPPAGPDAPPSPRAPRVLKVFTDGAARGNPGEAGAGAVLKKADGTLVAKLGKHLGEQTNNFAEYSALLLGLEAAHRLGADEVEVLSDSELMVRQLQRVYRVKSPGLKPLFEQAVQALGRFRKATIRHVPREQNAEADEMSNRAIDERL